MVKTKQKLIVYVTFPYGMPLEEEVAKFNPIKCVCFQWSGWGIQDSLRENKPQKEQKLTHEKPSSSLGDEFW